MKRTTLTLQSVPGRALSLDASSACALIRFRKLSKLLPFQAAFLRMHVPPRKFSVSRHGIARLVICRKVRGDVR